MTKVGYITREMFYMAKKYKLYVLLPLFMVFVLAALLIYSVGPAVIISFIYAGV